MDNLVEKTVEIRKQQQCCGCDRLFEKGSELLFIKWVESGEFKTCYWCDICLDITREWCGIDMFTGNLMGEYPEKFKEVCHEGG